MKRFSYKLIALAALICITVGFVSCKVKKPGSVRQGKDRAVTIVNKTGSNAKAYQVNVAGSGVEVEKGKANDGEMLSSSFAVKISSKFNKDTTLEVVLVDMFSRIYAVEIDVPLVGNTDVTIGQKDRKSEGMIKDSWKNLIAWFNQNK